MKTCGAKTRGGYPCKLRAGHGTNHLGTGRCKFHGGASSGGPPETLFKKGHRTREVHGLRAKQFPEEVYEMAKELKELGITPLEMMWDAIRLQWMAIIRAQKLMYVEDAEDHTKTLVSQSTGATTSEKYKVQLAEEKQARFLITQSNAIDALGKMLKQYRHMLTVGGLEKTEQELKVELLRAQVKALTGEDVELEDMEDILADVYDD